MTISLLSMLDNFRNDRIKLQRLSQTRLYVSRKFAADLKARTEKPAAKSPLENGMFPFGFPPLGGIPVIITDALPVNVPDKSKPIIQLGRFVECDAADMDWAEPLGLARWQTMEIHCVQSTDPPNIPEREPQHVVDEFLFRCRNRSGKMQPAADEADDLE